MLHENWFFEPQKFVIAEISFKLLKDRNFDKNSPLNTLEIAPLSEDRKIYLYKNIRQYVDKSSKDIIF